VFGVAFGAKGIACFGSVQASFQIVSQAWSLALIASPDEIMSHHHPTARAGRRHQCLCTVRCVVTRESCEAGQASSFRSLNGLLRNLPARRGFFAKPQHL
jgi:hypothetical protein